MGLIFFAFFEKFFVPILTSGGYVGLSIATLLSQHHQVTAVDIIPEKVDMINNRNLLLNDDCIYTPGVMVFKSDTDYPQLLPEEKWYSVNVLTCAAPNLREHPSNEMNAGDGDAAVHISREDLQALHEKRMRRVLEIAWAKGNEVVILGAFGCGAFRNPPAVVAQAMKTVVQEYRMRFETIEFAVYCGAQYDTNYRVFQQVLGGM